MNWIIGIDTAGNGIHYQIQSLLGEKIAAGQATKSLAGWSSFRGICTANEIDPAQTLAVIEATGRHHLPWCERLLAEGFTVYALNPLLSKRLHSSHNAIRDNKDDPIDAHTLAEIGRIHRRELERFCYRPQAGRLRVQTLVSARKTVRGQCTNLLKSAGDLLNLVFPEAASLKLKLTSGRVRALLRQAPTPARLAKLPMPRLREAVGANAQALQEAARSSLTTDDVAAACSVALVHLLESIDELFRQIGAFEHAIKYALSQESASREVERLIRSLPGFGKISAATLAAILPPDFVGWGNKKKITAKLQAYFGSDPRRRISGTQKGKFKISKRGVEIGRTVLYQASFCSIRHDPQMRRYYQKKKAEHDHHKKAIVDLMRKNLRRLVCVLVEQKPYEPRLENG